MFNHKLFPPPAGLAPTLKNEWSYSSSPHWTIKSWNQLPAGLLASFLCKLNTFRKRVKNVVTSKGIQVGIECR